MSTPEVALDIQIGNWIKWNLRQNLGKGKGEVVEVEPNRIKVRYELEPGSQRDVWVKREKVCVVSRTKDGLS